MFSNYCDDNSNYCFVPRDAKGNSLGVNIEAKRYSYCDGKMPLNYIIRVKGDELEQKEYKLHSLCEALKQYIKDIKKKEENEVD